MHACSIHHLILRYSLDVSSASLVTNDIYYNTATAAADASSVYVRSSLSSIRRFFTWNTSEYIYILPEIRGNAIISSPPPALRLLLVCQSVVVSRGFVLITTGDFLVRGIHTSKYTAR